MCHLDRACYRDRPKATKRIIKDVLKASNKDTCPKCGCQTKYPFGINQVIHDVEICKGLTNIKGF